MTTWTRSTLWLYGLLFSMTVAAVADVPRQIHYQGKLRDSSGVAVTGSVDLRFRLYNNSAGTGTPLFDETHGGVTVNQGLFSVLIGSETVGGVPNSSLNAVEVYLGISVGGGTELTPRTPIASTPHSVKAQSAEQLVKPDTFDAAATIDGSGSLDLPSDGATVRLPRKTASGDPSGLDGMVYYNSGDAKFRVHEDGQWADMRGGSSGAAGCPDCGAWTLLATVDTTRPEVGEFGSIDISDGAFDYLVVVFRNSTATEYVVGASPPWAIQEHMGFTYTIQSYSPPLDVAFNVQVKATNGTWLTTNSFEARPLLIRRGATWGDASASGVLVTSVTYLKIYGNGIVKVLDDENDGDRVLAVFSR